MSNTSIPHRTPDRYAANHDEDHDQSNPGDWNKSMNHRSAQPKDPKLPQPHSNKWEMRNDSDTRKSNPSHQLPEKNSKVDSA